MLYLKVNDTQLSTGMKEHVINTYKNNQKMGLVYVVLFNIFPILS